MKKRLISLLLATVMVLSFFAVFAACDKGESDDELLNRYIFDKDGQVVNGQFTLDRYMGENNEYELVWTSSNERALKLTQQQDTYLAEPVMGDERVTVTLTVTLGKAQRTFTVIVQAYTANVFASEFHFAKSNATVSNSFALDDSVSIGERTATITWSVVAGSEVASIANGQCVINKDALTEEGVTVTLQAQFTYNTSTANRQYSFTAKSGVDHAAQIHEWYSTQGAKMDFSGYVAAVGQTMYNGRVSLCIYILDDVDFQHGIYLYQGSAANDSDVQKLTPGVHVTVNGITAQAPYNGLIEGKGTLAVDGNIPPINMEEKILDITEDLIGNVPELTSRTGALVKGTAWEVSKISTEPAVGGSYSGTMVELTKDGATLKIGYSNYMEGSYVSRGNGYDPDATLKGIWDKVRTLNVGDKITVTGILSNYNAWQILPRDADDIQVVTQADAPRTAGKNAATAITTVTDALKAKGIEDNALIAKPIAGFELPTTSTGNVAISYRLCSQTPVATLTDGNKLAVTPAADEKAVYLEATYTVGDYTTHSYHKIKARALTDAEIVADIKSTLELPATIEWDQEVTLPATNETYEGSTVTWDFKADTTHATVTKTDSKLTFTLGAASENVTLVATINYNGVQDTKEFVIEVKAKFNGIILTGDRLPLTGSYANGEGMLENVTFAWTGLMRNPYDDYLGAIQGRSSKQTTLYTKTALTKNVVSIKAKMKGSNNFSNENVFIVTFAASLAELDTATDTQKVQMNTTAGQTEYTITAPAGNWTFFKITWGDDHASYWDRIEINFAA